MSGTTKSKSKAQAQTDAATAVAATMNDELVEHEFLLLKAIFYNLYIRREPLPYREVMAKLGGANPFTYKQYKILFNALVSCHKDDMDKEPAMVFLKAKADGLDTSIVRFDEVCSASYAGIDIDTNARVVMERQAKAALIDTLMAAQSDCKSAYTVSAIIGALKQRLDGLELGQGIRVDDMADFISEDIPDNEVVIDPVLREKDLAMIYADRGTGKTWFTLSIAISMATGKQCIDLWSIPKPRRVLYIDGEMSSRELQTRSRQIYNGLGAVPDKGFFKLFASDRQDRGMPNLATVEGQAQVDSICEQAEVIFLDNLSTLVGVEDENDAAAWQPIQRWLIDLRRRGKVVVLIHHASRSGGARGTSKREDVLNLVLKLKKVEGKTDACFDVLFEKNRSLTGEQTQAFRLELRQDGDAVTWLRGETTSEVVRREKQEQLQDAIRAMSREGKTYREICCALKISQREVSKALKEK